MTNAVKKSDSARQISKGISYVYFDRVTNSFRCIDTVADRPNVLKSREFTKDERHLFELAATVKEYSESIMAYNYGHETGDSGITQTAVSDCVENLETLFWDIFILEDYNQQQKVAA